MRVSKFGDVFNERRQLVSDIGRYIITWMPQRKFFVVTGILVFDFELFIGGLRQLLILSGQQGIRQKKRAGRVCGCQPFGQM